MKNLLNWFVRRRTTTGEWKRRRKCEISNQHFDFLSLEEFPPTTWIVVHKMCQLRIWNIPSFFISSGISGNKTSSQGSLVNLLKRLSIVHRHSISTLLPSAFHSLLFLIYFESIGAWSANWRLEPDASVVASRVHVASLATNSDGVPRSCFFNIWLFVFNWQVTVAVPIEFTAGKCKWHLPREKQRKRLCSEQPIPVIAMQNAWITATDNYYALHHDSN